MQKLALAVAHALKHSAGRVVGNVDNKLFHRLASYPVDFLIHDLRSGNLKFVPLATHVFDQNGKVHFAPAADAVAVGGVRFFNA